MTRTLIQKRFVLIKFSCVTIDSLLIKFGNFVDCGRGKSGETNARNEQEENKGCETRYKDVFRNY